MSVSCRHLLLKHTGSRNPLSRRDGKTVSRTKQEAHDELNEILKNISNNCTEDTFSNLSAEYSECSSYKKGGDLGEYGKGVMDPEFEKYSFSLGVNQLSGIVDSASGSHLIFRYR
eukprot:GHVR01142226.1.p1 GENE.GHVR01142226.1~~GHVR01142226.1.p1  ORF type:complete len:115 (+),score=23.22 GHVR01142226.1:32-376(+)